MTNPFLNIIKADELEAHQAHTLFVPEASPIWEQIQSSRNQIIVGPRGSGKTIALRQLDHRTMQHPLPFVGLYIQLSRISTIFKSLFEQATQARDERLLMSFQHIFSDYLWISIVQKLTEFFTSNSAYSKSINSEAIECLVNIKVNGLSDLESYCLNQHRDIERRIQDWFVTNKIIWNPITDLPLSLERCAESLRKISPSFRNDGPSLYLLFDESSPIPIQCQQVLNSLLHRGRPYCVKLAIRPFEWDSLETLAERTVELNTDLSPLFIRYPDELEGNYIRTMCTVVERVLETQSSSDDSINVVEQRFDCNKIFPSGDSSLYSGFKAICAASSGNPQNLLQICSCIYEVTHPQDIDLDTLSFPPKLQDQAIRAWSKDYEEQNPYNNSQTFCRALLKRIRKNRSDVTSIGFSYMHEESETLFTTEYLPRQIGGLIKPAFSGGFLRGNSPSTHSLFDVASDFQVSRGMLPREGLPLGLPIEPTSKIDRKFVQANVRDWVHSNRGTEDESGVKPIRAFLSTAFSPATQQQRLDIKRVLKYEQVVCMDLEDALEQQFLFSSISKAIRDSDITILDATILRPYTMFEIGLCAGNANKPKNVICIINEEDKTEVITDLPKFMQVLPIKSFTFEEDRLRKMAAEVVSHAKKLNARPSEFSQVFLTDTKLRPRRKNNTVYISLPGIEIRDRAISQIKERLEQEKWSIIVEEDAAMYSANDFQVPIYCAYMCRVGVIDTSGHKGKGPDLLQCYKLGLFAGKRSPWRVLQTESTSSVHSDTFASVPGVGHIAWNTLDELVNAVVKFVLGGSP